MYRELTNSIVCPRAVSCETNIIAGHGTRGRAQVYIARPPQLLGPSNLDPPNTFSTPHLMDYTSHPRCPSCHPPWATQAAADNAAVDVALQRLLVESDRIANAVERLVELAEAEWEWVEEPSST